MKKIIKKWGDSLVITFSSEEVKAYDFKKDEIIDIEIKKEESK